MRWQKVFGKTRKKMFGEKPELELVEITVFRPRKTARDVAAISAIGVIDSRNKN